MFLIWRSQFIKFSFITNVICVLLNNLLTRIRSLRFSYIFSSRGFIFLYLIFKSRVHVKLLCMRLSIDVQSIAYECPFLLALLVERLPFPY